MPFVVGIEVRETRCAVEHAATAADVVDHAAFGFEALL
jgi:hypothetical protein